MKNKIILFGAGFYGKSAYYKFRDKYEIVYFVDNNKTRHGQLLCGVKIISFEQLKSIELQDKDLLICTTSYEEIEKQILSIGIEQYYIFFEGYVYKNSKEETMIPVEISHIDYYRKHKGEKNILFAQNSACIRTHKIASIMKAQGYKVLLLYTLAPPDSSNVEYQEIYDGIYGFSTINAIVDFVNNSEFDIIHSSNAPDMLTNILLCTNKIVVHDTHDMNSLWGNDGIEELVLEYMANKHSAANIYTSEAVTEIAKKKYNLANKPVFTLENYILEQESVDKEYEKLSNIDGEIHSVYEGGIVGDNPESDRFFEEIWSKITAQGIHIHFYSQGDEKYCRKLDESNKYIHYEGNIGSKALIREMTKYDCGLAIFNVNDRNRLFMETGTANKVYEYINSGIPVAVGDLESYKSFVEGHGVGKQINFDGDIKKQFESLIKINIPKNFLRDNGLTMMSKGKKLAAFYEQVKMES